MSDKASNALPAVVPAVVLSLIIGGIGGFAVRYFIEPPHSAPTIGGETASPMAGAGGGGGRGGGMGGGMGGGQQSNSAALARTIRNLAIMEKVQNKGITAQQSQALLPVLKKIQSADKLSDKECEDLNAEIEKSLNDPQKDALKEMTPQRGGGGGLGAGMQMASGAAMAGRQTRGAPTGAGAGMMGGGGGGGGRPDPERPFASERNKKSLEDLIASVGGSGAK